MIRHLLTLVWNRRRYNALVAVEVLLSFLVLVAVLTTGAYFWDNYRRPLGFDYRDVWSIRVTPPTQDGPSGVPGEAPDFGPARTRIEAMLGLLRDLPETVAVSAVGDAPYSLSGWYSSLSSGGRQFSFGANRAGDAFAEAAGLVITKGRWFAASDEADQLEPVVINERFARELFGRDEAVGRVITPEASRTDERRRTPAMRVVGVMLDYRKEGDFSPPGNWVFLRSHTTRAASFGPPLPRYLVVRTRPGTTAAFEARFMALLNRSAPDWSFKASPLVLARSAMLRNDLPVLAAGALVASFLLAMVTLGLTGVLWLTVTQRTREIGLRRAKGATAGDIQRQVVGEVLVLTAVAVLSGIAVAVQFPVLEVFPSVTWPVYAVGLGLAAVAVTALASACAWVPSRLAGAVVPADALRYE